MASWAPSWIGALAQGNYPCTDRIPLSKPDGSVGQDWATVVQEFVLISQEIQIQSANLYF